MKNIALIFLLIFSLFFWSCAPSNDDDFVNDDTHQSTLDKIVSQNKKWWLKEVTYEIFDSSNNVIKSGIAGCTMTRNIHMMFNDNDIWELRYGGSDIWTRYRYGLDDETLNLYYKLFGDWVDLRHETECTNSHSYIIGFLDDEDNNFIVDFNSELLILEKTITNMYQEKEHKIIIKFIYD